MEEVSYVTPLKVERLNYLKGLLDRVEVYSLSRNETETTVSIFCDLFKIWTLSEANITSVEMRLTLTKDCTRNDRERNN